MRDDEADFLHRRAKLGSPLSVAQLVGTRVHEARDNAKPKISQAELGRRVQEILGKSWPKQIVYAIEKGDRECKASELLALAHVLGVPVAHFFEPHHGLLRGPDPWVKFPSGLEATGKQLHALVVGEREADLALLEVEMRGLIGELNGKLLKLRHLATEPGGTDGKD